MKPFSKKTLVFLSVAMLFNACSKEEAQKKQMPPQPVSTITAKSEDIPLHFSYPAQLVSDYDAIIKPQVSGVVIEKFFEAGQRVKKGDKLFLIEPDKFQANVNMAYGKALNARANFENANKEFKRNKVLIEKKAISQKEYDTSLANYNSTKASLTSARAELQNARIDLAYTEVKAPFDGMVGDALINIGTYVNASSTELVRITNLNPIYADFYISDTDKLKLKRNVDSGKWELENLKTNFKLNGVDIEGNLTFIDSVIDTKSGSVKAKAVFDNQNGTLLPGIFTTITSQGFMQKDGFKIPQIAILRNQEDVYVYTLVNSEVVKTPIEVVYQTNDYAVVSRGLKNGDKIITNNFKKIRPGAKVNEVGSK
ncbi:efflux RND transporter periplasmic adaptor subunit [Campylobacter helveticus]|uniref:efflux RND transporter periplasmic adaptor subunit n=1 Tax=Campylobacter helveticus TaxID=28898 RepID=UPI00214A245F|nr:efflux RND transporter periplasmic adaptor subunit [Campylobacter helveticus]MCR2065732.1 efflux RND transporter periplasmic adaptor subunit [Campylobacter helveticus]